MTRMNNKEEYFLRQYFMLRTAYMIKKILALKINSSQADYLKKHGNKNEINTSKFQRAFQKTQSLLAILQHTH